MKISVTATILGITIVLMIAAHGSSAAPPKGYCKDGQYKFCDWASWLQWEDCSNGCGTGIKTRTKLICCPPDIKLNNITKCVVDMCHFTMAQYQEDATCTSRQYCNQGSSIQFINKSLIQCFYIHFFFSFIFSFLLNDVKNSQFQQ